MNFPASVQVGSNGTGDVTPGTFSESIGYKVDAEFFQEVIRKTPSATPAIDDLYPEKSIMSPHLRSAFELLDDGLGYLSIALPAYRANDLLISDDAILRVHSIMPELFCLRALGEGFGSVINSVWNALRNSADKTLDITEIIAVNSALHRLRVEPFLSFEIAMAISDKLEESGMVLEPEGFESIGIALEALDE